MRNTTITAVAVSVLATGLAVAPAGATVKRPFEGAWRMDGYGQVAVVKGGRLTFFQTTSISCAGDPDGLKQLGPPRKGVVSFGSGPVPEMAMRLRGHDRAALQDLGSVGDVRLTRLRALPARCGKPAPKDPVSTFDVFWATFAENYPFFAAKKIDWSALRARYRPQVTAQTTGDQLFKIFRAMLEPLHDNHTGLMDPDSGQKFSGHRPGTRRLTDELKARVDKAVAKRLGVPLRTWASGHVGYADLPGRLGYLRVTRFLDYTGEDTPYLKDLAELDRALNAVFTKSRTRTLRGLIIDVRYNGGGHDPLGLRIASRLTGKPYVAYVKRARNDPRDPRRFTPRQPIKVRPAKGPIYRGPVAMLTSDLSVSAAETFTLGMMNRSPRPVRIGRSTQGVFSDIMVRALPNGWYFALGNEDYRTPRGRTFEGPGIPPDLRTPVFTDAELNSGRDSAIDKAIETLS